MRNYFLIIFMLMPFYGVGQRLVKGQLLSGADSLPVANTTFFIGKKKKVKTDSLGYFRVRTFKRELSIRNSYGYSLFPDTIVQFRRANLPLKIYGRPALGAACARFDIAHGKAMLFCGGGFVTVGPTPEDKLFEQRYHVRYYYLDCVMPSGDQLYDYNRTVAEYLDKLYGNLWRKATRRDVH